MQFRADVRFTRKNVQVIHGARSQAVLRKRSGYVKQAVLQPLGIRQAELNPIARRYLDLYSRAAVKVDAYDTWASEHGFIDEDGRTPPWIAEYFTALNAAGRLLSKLEQHLHRHQQAGPSALDVHLAQHYADRNVVDG